MDETTLPSDKFGRALLASVKSPLLGGSTRNGSRDLNFLRRRSPGPPLRPAVATRGSGGQLKEGTEHHTTDSYTL